MIAKCVQSNQSTLELAHIVTKKTLFKQQIGYTCGNDQKQLVVNLHGGQVLDVGFMMIYMDVCAKVGPQHFGWNNHDLSVA